LPVLRPVVKGNWKFQEISFGWTTPKSCCFLDYPRIGSPQLGLPQNRFTPTWTTPESVHPNLDYPRIEFVIFGLPQNRVNPIWTTSRTPESCLSFLDYPRIGSPQPKLPQNRALSLNSFLWNQLKKELNERSVKWAVESKSTVRSSIITHDHRLAQIATAVVRRYYMY
jgi:hypothetical protein